MRTISRHVASALAITALGVSSFAFVVVTAGPAAAATIPVTNGDDSGAGSLRQAISTANADSGPSTIAVDNGVNQIDLTSPLVVTTNGKVTIDGTGTVINMHGATDGIDSQGLDLELDDLTITGVGPGDLGTDHAVVSTSGGGNPTLTNCALTGNSVKGDNAGVALSDGNALIITNCTISNNTVDADNDGGAALSEGGPGTLNGTTISGNTISTADGDGGAYLNEGGNNSLSDSHITGNTVISQGDGAALLSEGGGVTLGTSEIASNTVTADGNVAGGVDSEDGNVTLRSSSITCNTGSTGGGDAGGGIYTNGGDVALTDSTVNGNTGTSATGQHDNAINLNGG